MALSAAAPAVSDVDTGRWLEYLPGGLPRGCAIVHGFAAQPDLNAALRIPGMLQRAPRNWNCRRLSKQAAGRSREEAVPMLNQFRSAKARRWRTVMLRAQRRSASLVSQDGRDSRPRAGRLPEAPARAFGELLRGAVLDPQRLAQEAAILADRSDIGEEIVRLQTHAAQLAEHSRTGARSARRLDFLLQEMNRETNTILSKTRGIGDPGLESPIWRWPPNPRSTRSGSRL